MIEIAPVLASLFQISQLAKSALEARDDAKVQSALIDLNAKLHDLSLSALASVEKAGTLQTELAAAREEARRLQAVLDERASYALKELRAGACAYVSTRDDVPQHFLCQPCYDKGVKAILRHQPAKAGVLEHWTCPEGGVPHTIGVPGTALRHRVVSYAKADFP